MPSTKTRDMDLLERIVRETKDDLECLRLKHLNRGHENAANETQVQVNILSGILMKYEKEKKDLDK